MADSIGDAFVEAMAARVAALVAELVVSQLRNQPGFGAPIYATTANNPLGSRKAFLSAHRAGAFPSFRRGKEIAALWGDVETWMRTRPKKEAVALDLEAELDVAFAPIKRRRKSAA